MDSAPFDGGGYTGGPQSGGSQFPPGQFAAGGQYTTGQFASGGQYTTGQLPLPGGAPVYPPRPGEEPRSVASTKIVVAGGFGAGKTTFVGAVSEIVPLRTEAMVTGMSEGHDDLAATPGKETTTVAMDFGRIILPGNLVLYLFGTPGQRRFWFMWDDLIKGAIGAVVLVDTRRIEDSFAAVDFFEAKSLPFLIAVNRFPDAPRFPVSELREALSVREGVPIVDIDARDPGEVRRALAAVTEYAIERLMAAQRG